MLNAELVNRIDITDSLAIFQIRPDAGVPDFLPGQYLALGVLGSTERINHTPDPEGAKVSPDKILKRAYSIGSAPTEKGYIEFYIAMVPDGLLTPRLMSLKVGDRLYVAPKVVGTFTLGEVRDDKNLVLVSTGTGVAPYMSMIRSPNIVNEKRVVHLVHGVRYVGDLAYKEELEFLAKTNVNFKYYPVVSRPDETWSGRKGYVQGLFKSGEVKLDPNSDHVFICGNPAMIEDLEAYLVKDLSYTVHSRRTPGNLHLEKYW